MRWLLAFLLIVATPAAALAQTPGQTSEPPAEECSGVRPTLQVQQTRGDWHRNNWANAVNRLLVMPGDPVVNRSKVDPRSIGLSERAQLLDYDESSLMCWAEKGDQLAAYAVALRLGNQTSDAHSWLDLAVKGKDVLEERDADGEIPVDVCAANVDTGDMSCAYGLPEAQALVGTLICAGKRPGTKADGRYWIERAIRGGLWSAAQFRDNYCKD